MSILPLTIEPMIGTNLAQNRDVIPLDDRILGSISEKIIDVRNQKQMVLNEISQGDFLADPQKLILLQREISDASIGISLVSAISRKATATVETLLKS